MSLRLCALVRVRCRVAAAARVTCPLPTSCPQPPPPPPPPPGLAKGAGPSDVLEGVSRLLAALTLAGYSLNFRATPGGPDRSSSGGSSSGSGRAPLVLTIRIEGPATLWGMQALAARRAPLITSHDALAVGAWLRASGRSAVCTLSWTDAAVSQVWEVY